MGFIGIKTLQIAPCAVKMDTHGKKIGRHLGRQKKLRKSGKRELDNRPTNGASLKFPSSLLLQAQGASDERNPKRPCPSYVQLARPSYTCRELCWSKFLAFSYFSSFFRPFSILSLTCQHSRFFQGNPRDV